MEHVLIAREHEFFVASSHFTKIPPDLCIFLGAQTGPLPKGQLRHPWMALAVSMLYADWRPKVKGWNWNLDRAWSLDPRRIVPWVTQNRTTFFYLFNFLHDFLCFILTNPPLRPHLLKISILVEHVCPCQIVVLSLPQNTHWPPQGTLIL